MNDDRVRIFVSSPADVEHERAIVKDILERLSAEFLPYFRIEPVLWEDEALTADRTFQAGMVRPSDCDIVLVVLWTRLGSPLPQDPYQGRTGTEWEFFDAVEASATGGRPEVLVYKKTNPKLVDVTNPQQTLQAVEERKRVEEFFQRHFFNEDHTFRRAFRAFDSDAAFRNLVEVQLRKLLNRRIFVERRGPGQAFEWSGSPFRPDAPFGFGDERVFTGREGETRELLSRLQEQAGGGEAFLLVSGPSGCGKTSLLLAGVLPRLVRPHQIPRVAACRWCLVDPSGRDRPIDVLARALCSPRGLGDRLADLGMDAEVLGRGLKADPDLAVRQIRAALDGLTRAYRDDTGEAEGSVRLAILVDPLEALLRTEGGDAAFFTALAALAGTGPVWVIALVRSDRLRDLGQMGALADLVAEKNWFRLEPVPASRSRQVIEIPALVAGLRFSTDVRERMPELLEAQTQGARLWAPLLEGTLERLFQGQISGVSPRPGGAPRRGAAYPAEGGGARAVEATTRGLVSLGGLEGDAVRRAEAVWAGSREEVRAALPRLCRALIELEGRGAGRPAPRAADLDALESEPAAAELVRALIDARVLLADGERDPALLSRCGGADDSLRSWLGRALRGARPSRPSAEGGADVDGPAVQAAGNGDGGHTAVSGWRDYRRTVALVHPRLVASWRPMADWFASPENRQELELRAQITRQAHLWKRTDCNSEHLLGEGGFAAAGRFAQAHPDELEPAERELLEHSARALRARRRSQRLVRGTGIVLVSLLALASLSAFWAWEASRTATVNLHRSLLKEADLAISRGNTPEAVVLALDAARHLPQQSANSLSRTLTSSHLVALAHEGPPLAGLPLTAAIDRRGRRLLTSDPAVGLRFWRLDGTAFEAEGPPWGAELGIHLVLFADHAGEGVFLGVSPRGVWRLPLSGGNAPDYPCGADRGGLHALASDGRRLALTHALSADEDAVCVLDLDRPGAVALDLAPNAGEVRSLAFSPDGTRLLSAGGDGLLRVFDAADGRTLLTLPQGAPLRGRINRAVFDSQGRRIAVATSDHRVRIFGPDGKLVRELVEVEEAGAVRRVHDAEVRDLAFTSDGASLVAADDDGQVVRWGLGGRATALVLGRHADTVELVRMAPGGARVLTASRDGTARLWDLVAGSLQGVFGHDGAVSDAAFTAGGRRVLTESAEDGTVRLWDAGPVPRLGRLLPHRGHVRHVAFAAPGTTAPLRLATASSSGLVRVWDLEVPSGPPLVLSGHADGVADLDFSADGSRLATAGRDGTARIWDLTVGGTRERSLCRLPVSGEAGARVNRVLFEPTPQPRWLATYSDLSDAPLRLWDTETCAPVAADAVDGLSGAGSRAAAVRRLADGILVAAGLDDGRVRVLFASEDGDWSRRCDLRQHTRAVLDMDFSPDGKRLATASDDRWARVLALDSCGGGAESLDLVGHTDSVRGVRFSADGRRLVTASMDGTARVWGLEGEEVAVLRDHSNRVYHAEFGAADRLILTASRDGAVRVWENPPPGGDAQPSALLVYTAELGGIPHAAFSPDGRYVAAGYWRNAAMLWRLIEPPGEPPDAHSQPTAAPPAPVRDLAVLEEARRFRRQNRIDDLLDVPWPGR